MCCRAFWRLGAPKYVAEEQTQKKQGRRKPTVKQLVLQQLDTIKHDAGHFSRTVSQRSDAIAHTIGGYPVHQATSAGAA